jgi:hypothetical protein
VPASAEPVAVGAVVGTGRGAHGVALVGGLGVVVGVEVRAGIIDDGASLAPPAHAHVAALADGRRAVLGHAPPQGIFGRLFSFNQFQGGCNSGRYSSKIAHQISSHILNINNNNNNNHHHHQHHRHRHLIVVN